MRSAVAIVAMAVLAIGSWVAPASAQEDGVYFDDPDSPGGKEYSIPHERERRDNGDGGGAGDGGGSGDETPRFGAGIEPGEGGSGGGSGGSSGGGSGGGEGSSGVAGESASGEAAGGGDGSKGDSADGGSSGGEASGGAAGEAGSEDGASYQATSSSSDPELSLSVLALGVILIGGGFGLLLRRSRRNPPPASPS